MFCILFFPHLRCDIFQNVLCTLFFPHFRVYFNMFPLLFCFFLIWGVLYFKMFSVLFYFFLIWGILYLKFPIGKPENIICSVILIIIWCSVDHITRTKLKSTEEGVVWVFSFTEEGVVWVFSFTEEGVVWVFIFIVEWYSPHQSREGLGFPPLMWWIIQSSS